MQEEAKLVERLNYLKTLCDTKTIEQDNLEKMNSELQIKQLKHRELNEEGKKLISEIQSLDQLKREQKTILERSIVELNRLKQMQVKNWSDDDYKNRIGTYTVHCNENKLKQQMDLQNERISLAKALRELPGWT